MGPHSCESVSLGCQTVPEPYVVWEKVSFTERIIAKSWQGIHWGREPVLVKTKLGTPITSRPQEAEPAKPMTNLLVVPRYLDLVSLGMVF